MTNRDPDPTDPGPISGDKWRQVAEDDFAKGNWKPAQRDAARALRAWGEAATDDQLDWYADIMERLEAVDPVLGPS